MPLAVISQEQSVKGVEAMDSEMRFLLEEKKIPVEVIGLLGHLGMTDLPTIAHIESSEDKFREMIGTELGLESEVGMACRIMISNSSMYGTQHEKEIKRGTRKLLRLASREGSEKCPPTRMFRFVGNIKICTEN